MTPIVLPIIKKETEVRSRRIRFVSLIVLLNMLFFLISIVGSYAVINHMRAAGESSYGWFLRVYMFTAAAEYLLIFFAAVFFTAASISGERERGTMDLILTTGLTPSQIVLEKMAAAFISAATIIVSGLPALTVPLIFGGVGFVRAVSLIISFFPGVFLALAVGMYASSRSFSVIGSIALAFAGLTTLSGGFILLAFFMSALPGEGCMIGAVFIFIDPLFAPFLTVSGQIGVPEFCTAFLSFIGQDALSSMLSFAPFIGMIADICIGIVLILLSILCITPGRKAVKKSGGASGKPA